MNIPKPSASGAAPAVSVIIVTKNRDVSLKTVSLPSLARQVFKDFEVIVWDASPGEESREVVGAFAAATPGVSVRYAKALRAGIASQRNDSVETARGEIVFFIDDDSEVSPDGLGSLIEMFSDDPALAGGCLPLDYRWPEESGETAPPGVLYSFLVKRYWRLFIGQEEGGRFIRSYGAGPSRFPKEEGPIDHLWGCDMAFRRRAIEGRRFEERLQRYTGTAIEEDDLFSHLLYREGFKMRIAKRGLVIHRAAPGNRFGSPFNDSRVHAYNSALFWRKGVFPFNRGSLFSFLWVRAGVFGFMLLRAAHRPWQRERWQIVSGYARGFAAFLIHDMFAHTALEAANLTRPLAADGPGYSNAAD